MPIDGLRHSVTSFMIAWGIPLRVTVEVLRHSDIGVPADTSGRILPELTRAATTGIAASLLA